MYSSGLFTYMQFQSYCSILTIPNNLEASAVDCTVWHFPTLLRRNCHWCKGSPGGRRGSQSPGEAVAAAQAHAGRGVCLSCVCGAGAPSMCQWHFLHSSMGPGVLQWLGTSLALRDPLRIQFQDRKVWGCYFFTTDLNMSPSFPSIPHKF